MRPRAARRCPLHEFRQQWPVEIAELFCSTVLPEEFWL
jgi:hypothetical protein